MRNVYLAALKILNQRLVFWERTYAVAGSMFAMRTAWREVKSLKEQIELIEERLQPKLKRGNNGDTKRSPSSPAL